MREGRPTQARARPGGYQGEAGERDGTSSLEGRIGRLQAGEQTGELKSGPARRTVGDSAGQMPAKVGGRKPGERDRLSSARWTQTKGRRAQGPQCEARRVPHCRQGTFSGSDFLVADREQKSPVRYSVAWCISIRFNWLLRARFFDEPLRGLIRAFPHNEANI